MTKILFFTIDGGIGGTERMMLDLAAGLPRDRFAVSILTVKPAGKLHRRAEALGIPAFSLGTRDKGAFFLVFFRFYRFLLKSRPDLLQTFLFYPNVIGRVAGWLAAIPAVVGGQRSTDCWRCRHHQMLERFTAPLGRLLVSNSEAGRQMLIRQARLAPDRVLVIPNGVAPVVPLGRPEARRRLGLPAEGLLIGVVGNLKKPKGHHYLLPAFREVLQAIPGARLLLAGDGPLRAELEDFSRRLQIDRSVVFLGFVDDLGPFYSALDIFVLPSLWEGMPVALLEAMSYGLPSVASEVSGVPEVVDDGREGFLVEPANPQLLARRLLELVGDVPGRQAMGASARARVERDFSLEAMVDRYAALYQALVRETGAD